MAETDAGDLVRMEKDYSGLVDEQLPLARAAARDGDLSAAMEILTTLERRTRTAADTHSLTRVLVATVQILFQANAYDLLNETILSSAKRRGQMKQSLGRMVQECCAQLENMSDEDPDTVTLIESLRTITLGKIYAEVERARLSHRLALIKERQGENEEAAKIMLELQIETFGSMAKTEKVKFILEQMRLSLARGDFVRTQIVSKKVNAAFFAGHADDPIVDEQRVRYYTYMAELDEHDENYLAVSGHHWALYETGSVSRDVGRRLHHLKTAVLYLLLAPFAEDQSEQLRRMALEPELDQVPAYRALVKLFGNLELIRWKTLKQTYETELRLGTPDSPPTNLFPRDDENGERRWSTFNRRVVEHNIRVIARYYTRITLRRMSQLLELPPARSEQALADMVTAGVVAAKIDRLDGTVAFVRSKGAEERLDDWCDTIDELMRLVAKTTHLVNKEHMVHQHLLPTPAAAPRRSF